MILSALKANEWSADRTHALSATSSWGQWAGRMLRRTVHGIGVAILLRSACEAGDLATPRLAAARPLQWLEGREHQHANVETPTGGHPGFTRVTAEQTGIYFTNTLATHPNTGITTSTNVDAISYMNTAIFKSYTKINTATHFNPATITITPLKSNTSTTRSRRVAITKRSNQRF